MKSTEPKPETASQVAASTAETSRRPYHQPKLRRLGSVRDLTLGSKGNFGDGGVSQKNSKGGM